MVEGWGFSIILNKDIILSWVREWRWRVGQEWDSGANEDVGRWFWVSSGSEEKFKQPKVSNRKGIAK